MLNYMCFSKKMLHCYLLEKTPKEQDLRSTNPL